MLLLRLVRGMLFSLLLAESFLILLAVGGIVVFAVIEEVGEEVFERVPFVVVVAIGAVGGEEKVVALRGELISFLLLE